MRSDESQRAAAQNKAAQRQGGHAEQALRHRAKLDKLSETLDQRKDQLASQPGTYHTNGSGESCYYALLSGTGGSGIDDIIDNNNITGPVTLSITSPFFESTRCGTWTKVG